jgi:ATP-dependent DNA ligase
VETDARVARAFSLGQVRVKKRTNVKTTALALKQPFEPMEANSASGIPTGSQWQYEPKWDGFRCVAFKSGDDVYLQSRSCKPLARYFPEIVAALEEHGPAHVVLDGELIIAEGKTLSFDLLLERIHPAASRVAKLAEETPATFVLFDVLVDEKNRSLISRPLRERRAALERIFAKYFRRHKRFALSPATRQLSTVRKWFARSGGALDGIVAKRADEAYRSGERSAVTKVKQIRTADCVVGGFRYSSDGKSIGSLLLGLYDRKGLLNHVGFVSGFSREDRAALRKRIEPLRKPPGFTGNKPGGPSRWSTDRSEQWEPLAPKLVVEVSFDHVTGERFRHATGFVRWRPDKAPRQCTMDQMKVAAPLSLLDLAR